MSKKRSLRHEECDDDPLPKSKKPCRKIKGPKLPEHIKEIKDLSVLIEVAEFIEKQQSRRKKEQGLWKLSLCIDELKELNNLIGLKDLKQQVTKQIMFFVLELNDDEMMHTVISGPPGMAKTTIAETLGILYANLGFLSSGHVLCATRSNLIGKYLGETSIKTGEVLNASLGGILIIDEAYSLGTKDGNDSYSSECLNTLNQFLSENPSDFMCIIAGYEKELKNRFFSMNPGLERRFPWWFKLEKYETSDLIKIFKFQVEKKEWKLHEEVTDKWLDEQIRNKKELFNMNGGDTLILMDKSKISHAQRIFLDVNEEKRCFNRLDISNGLKMLEDYKKGNVTSMSESVRSMYS
jgi:stage V sporulation protein K